MEIAWLLLCTLLCGELQEDMRAIVRHFVELCRREV